MEMLKKLRGLKANVPAAATPKQEPVMKESEMTEVNAEQAIDSGEEEVREEVQDEDTSDVPELTEDRLRSTLLNFNARLTQLEAYQFRKNL